MSTRIALPSPTPSSDGVQEIERPAPRFDALAWLIIALCVAGVGVALYLTYIHYSHAEPICTPGGGCEAVNSSMYSTVGPIPVALLGAGMYAGLLALTAVSRLSERLAAGALLARFGLALAGASYSAYLTYIALSVIRATCVWCLASLAIVTGVMLLSLWELLRPPARELVP